jgi:potassium efflux system protein
MDLADISAQARAVVAMVAAIAIGVGLGVLWSKVFPAFSVLNDVVLWTVSGTDENTDTLAKVTLQGLALAVVIAFFTFFAARNLPGMLEVAFLSRLNLSPGTGYAITTICSYIIVLAGAIIALGMLGAEWSKLQWLVAALGVGLGFGLQEIVANFISGIIILFERPMRVGDTVTVGTETGTVSRIRIRATTITGWDRKELIIPNKTFVTEQLTNWTLSDTVTRVIVGVGVAYTTHIDQAQQVLEDVATANTRVIDDPPPAVFCVAFGDSRIDFEIRVFVGNMMDILPLIHELHAAAFTALREAGIDIPFPQLDMHIKSGPPLPGMDGSEPGPTQQTDPDRK